MIILYYNLQIRMLEELWNRLTHYVQFDVKGTANDQKSDP